MQDWISTQMFALKHHDWQPHHQYPYTRRSWFYYYLLFIKKFKHTPINKHKNYKMINTLKNSEPTFFSFGCSVLNMHVNISLFMNDCWLTTSRTIDACSYGLFGCWPTYPTTFECISFFSVFSFESYLVRKAQ